MLLNCALMFGLGLAVGITLRLPVLFVCLAGLLAGALYDVWQHGVSANLWQFAALLVCIQAGYIAGGFATEVQIPYRQRNRKVPLPRE